MVDASMSLPTPLSTLLAVPIPDEYQEAGARVQEGVERAIKEMFEQRLERSGKDVSPWLLKRVGELTGHLALDLSKLYTHDSPANSRCQAHRE